MIRWNVLLLFFFFFFFWAYGVGAVVSLALADKQANFDDRKIQGLFLR